MNNNDPRRSVTEEQKGHLAAWIQRLVSMGLIAGMPRGAPLYWNTSPTLLGSARDQRGDWKQITTLLWEHRAHLPQWSQDAGLVPEEAGTFDDTAEYVGTGAAIGSAVGSVFGPVGTVVGGAIGAVAGFIGSLF